MATATNPLDTFIWGQGGAQLTPEEIARQREMATALLQSGADYSPVTSWTQGLARLVQGGLGGLLDRRAEEGEQANNAYGQSIISSLFGGGDASASPIDVSGAAAGDPSYRDAIASIESAGSGDYGAVGPTNPDLGRALGRYQIMEANIGPWSQEALGRTVTPDEFLANPQLQDAIFDHQFGKYVQQFGPEGAAQAWFAGPGGVGKLNRQDALGTTVGDYTQRFSNALGQSGGTPTAQAPMQPQAGGTAQIAKLLAAAGDPRLNNNQRSIVNALLQSQLTQQTQAADPLRQLQIQKAQAEIDALRAKPAQPLINAGGGAIYDPTTGEWLTAPNSGQTAPKIVELFDDQSGLPYKAQWNPKTETYDRIGGVKAPSGTSLTVDPATGAVSFTQGAGMKPLTEAQSKDAVFATRASGALPILDQYSTALTDPVQRAMEADPTGFVRGNQSPEFQQAQQAGLEFLQAILRKDTGAAITPSEQNEYGKTYLPQPGDGPEVLERKKASRTRALEALKAGMAPQAILNMEKALGTDAPAETGKEAPPSDIDSLLKKYGQ